MSLQLSRLIFFFLILLLPSQLALHFWPSWSYVSGLPVDYLSPTLYVTDLLVIALLILTKPRIPLRLPLPILVFAVINTMFSISPEVTLMAWFRLLEFYWLYLYFRKFINPRHLPLPLSLSLIWVSLLGWLQFLNQSSLGGLWSFLGERPLSPIQLGVAKINLCLFSQPCSLLLRPYATLPHPNALAGFLLVSAILLIGFINFPSRWRALYVFSLLFALITIPLTFSRTVIFLEVTILASYLFLSHSSRFLARLLLVVFMVTVGLWIITFGNPSSIPERWALIQKSASVISSRWIVGSGLATFPVYPYSLSQYESSLNHQPVHNIYLLLFSEIGLPVTLIILFFAIQKIRALDRSHSWNLILLATILLITGLIDHYWLTLHQNQLLTVIVIFLVYNRPTNSYDQSS